MTGPADGVPRGNPPVMTYDQMGNAVIDPREDEKVVDLAEASRASNDAKAEARGEPVPEHNPIGGAPNTGGRGTGTSGSKSSTTQPQKRGTGKTTTRKGK